MYRKRKRSKHRGVQLYKPDISPTKNKKKERWSSESVMEIANKLFITNSDLRIVKAYEKPKSHH